MSEKRPYKVYKARKRPWDRFKKFGSAALPRPGSEKRKAPARDPFANLRDHEPVAMPPARSGGPQREQPARRHRRGIRPRRPSSRLSKVKWVLLAVFLWQALSFALFLVSAQIQESKLSNKVENALSGQAGSMIWRASTILVIGSDQRPSGSKEPGANEGPARADSLMLLRVGAGHSGRLSILRDTYAQIPGHGAQKINASFAFGGAALTIETVEQYLGNGLQVDHVILVDFENFPKLIDALGGINIRVRERCIRGTFGGKRFYLRRGEHHANGKVALRYARIRKNTCAPNEDDRDRARRQQEVLSAIKSRAMSPATFFRLPWVSWAAPQTIVSDMGGPALMALFGNMVLATEPKPRVLKPMALGPGGSLIVSDQEKAREVRRFLKG